MDLPRSRTGQTEHLCWALKGEPQRPSFWVLRTGYTGRALEEHQLMGSRLYSDVSNLLGQDLSKAALYKVPS